MSFLCIADGKSVEGEKRRQGKKTAQNPEEHKYLEN